MSRERIDHMAALGLDPAGPRPSSTCLVTMRASEIVEIVDLDGQSVRIELVHKSGTQARLRIMAPRSSTIKLP